MDLTDFKDSQRTVWSGGDYRPVGRMLAGAAARLVEAARIREGQRVLDVGTGSGNVAVPAARAGASVLGVDIVDTWFDEARSRAAEAGVDVALRIGDAEQLPVDDSAFDAVLSSFAAIFAPRHDVVAAELVRACRPGGTVAFTAWPPGGSQERMFLPMYARMPEPPEFAMPAIRWGEEDYVRERFAPYSVDFEFEHRTLGATFSSADEFERFLFTNSGPMMALRGKLEELGQWDEAYPELRETIAAANRSDGGDYQLSWDYLLAVGSVPRA